MKKALIIIAVVVVLMVGAFLVAYPRIEIDTGNQLIRCSYSDDFSEYDVNHSYNEVYCYNEKHDVSLRNFEVKKYWFFYTITMDYVPGDVRKTEFLLPEEYIQNFIENADIYDNEKNIDLAELISGKTAVVESRRYKGNDYETGIYYILDGKEEVMYIFCVDELLVIQVGSSDENPRFIAYK